MLQTTTQTSAKIIQTYIYSSLQSCPFCSIDNLNFRNNLSIISNLKILQNIAQPLGEKCASKRSFAFQIMSIFQSIFHAKDSQRFLLIPYLKSLQNTAKNFPEEIACKHKFAFGMSSISQVYLINHSQEFSLSSYLKSL